MNWLRNLIRWFFHNEQGRACDNRDYIIMSARVCQFPANGAL